MPKPVGSLKRTFTGCWRCRARKVKCDEKTPTCTPCRKVGVGCSGYQQNLVWVESDQRSYKQKERRYIDPRKTWEGLSILSYPEVERLVDGCDRIIETEDVDALSCGPFSVLRMVPEPRPTGDTSSEDDIIRARSSCVSTRACESEQGDCFLLDNTDLPPESEDEWSLTLPTSPRPEPQLDAETAFLFHNYVNHVVPILIPVHTLENPWLRYPAIALQYSITGRKHLLYAIMALTAIFRSNTRADATADSKSGTKYYLKAMAELRAGIDRDTLDYVGLLTTMLTFLLIEHFKGNSKNWKYHLLAAWKYLQQHRHTISWSKSPDAWYVTQSFYLLRIEYETSATQAVDHPEFQVPMSLASNGEDSYGILSSNARFGSTMGASVSVMECISEINRLSKIRNSQEKYSTAKPIALCLVRMLSASSNLAKGTLSDDEMDDTAAIATDALRKEHEAHIRAFKTATLIYYYQTCDEVIPRDMAPYVAEVLESLATYRACRGGNPTLWPAFVAGAEVYTARGKSMVTELFESTFKMGMMNRVKMLALLKRVWQIRDSTALTTGQNPDAIRVDWREVMRDMDIDILLL